VAARGGDPPVKLRVFHFGNSLTGNAMPAWHADLGRSVGRTWENHVWLGAGWQLWMHRSQIGGGKEVFSPEARGDLTIDPGLVKSANEHVKSFHGTTWYAIVLQLFCPHLSYTTDEHGGKKFTAKTDIGDLQSAADLIALQVKRNPQTRVFVYQVWRPMDAGEPKDGMRGAGFPRRESFDHAARWSQEHGADSGCARSGFPWRSRSFGDQVFEGVKAKHPDLWKTGRLRMIPGGELFLELDKRFRAKAAPGNSGIRDFYTDVQHMEHARITPKTK
jgi:hypothetical protein